MFKQRVENKSNEAPDTIEIGGKVFHRAHYEDPERRGFTIPGRLYSSAELVACGRWDLLSPSGRRLAAHLPAERPKDPSIVTLADVPLKLREEAERAEAALNEVRARAAAALDRRCEAEAARRRAFDRRDVGGVTAAEHAYGVAEQARRDVEIEELPHRRRLSEATWKIQRWTWDEGLRRSGLA